MANYIIEGTVTEISIDEGFFTIAGTEGFAIKQGDDKYNVLCPEKMPTENDYLPSFILSQDVKFPIIDSDNELILKASSEGKKIKIKLVLENIVDLQKLQELVKKSQEVGKKYFLSLLSD